jgi:hypothetical protein
MMDSWLALCLKPLFLRQFRGLMPENRNAIEMHGCIVCARVFNILVIYTPDGKLVDCTVTSPGGRIVSDEQQPLVVCKTHATAEVEAAYQRWQSKKSQKTDFEQEEE